MKRTSLRWRVVAKHPAVDFRVLSVREQTARHEATGRSGRFTVVELPDWVNVIALTPADDVVLVKQYRHGTGRVTLEIPGGTVDPGEPPAAAARRELREETGYRTRRLRKLGVVEPNPAIQTNRCHLFLALDVEPGPASSPDPEEILEVVTLPLRRIPELLARGRIAHALVVAAFGHLVRISGGFRRPRSGAVKGKRRSPA